MPSFRRIAERFGQHDELAHVVMSPVEPERSPILCHDLEGDSLRSAGSRVLLRAVHELCRDTGAPALWANVEIRKQRIACLGLAAILRLDDPGDAYEPDQAPVFSFCDKYGATTGRLDAGEGVQVDLNGGGIWRPTAAFRRILRLVGTASQLVELNSVRRLVPSNRHELQESMEQPGLLRAQSGRLAA